MLCVYLKSLVTVFTHRAVLCVVCGQEDGRSTTVKPVAVGADDFLPMFTYVGSGRFPAYVHLRTRAVRATAAAASEGAHGYSRGQ
jgi:hypothetical protein